jgi:phosphoglycerate kinase
VEGVVQNDFRIRQSLPTIKFLKERGAHLILISHLGKNGEESLEPVFTVLRKHIPEIIFYSSLPPDETLKEKIENMKEGEIILLENLRKNPGEEQNGLVFSKELASLAELYINDAFSASHREHASIVGVPKILPGYAGFLLEKEVKELSKVLHPEHPFIFILGGAKFSTKIPLVEKYLPLADSIFIGGALAHDFWHARGLSVGKSLLDTDVDVSSFIHQEKITLPVDLVAKLGEQSEIKTIEKVLPDEVIVDAGPATIAELSEKMKGVKLIVWNGPLGNFEIGFKEGTESLAQKISENGSYSIVGGGDTLSAIENLGLFEIQYRESHKKTSGSK